MTNIQLPAYLKSSTAPDITDRLGANLGTAAPPYVSIMGGRFTLVDSAGDTEAVTTVDPKTGVPFLDCAIIDAGDHASKIYFGQAFDPNAQAYSPPKCWSDNGVAPSVNCSEPQALTCAADPEGKHGCRLAVWGSAVSKVSGKGIPACGKYQKLALLIPGDEMVFLLRVPPNSLENLRAYNAKFKGQPFSVRDVVTRVSFEQQGIGTLTFYATPFDQGGGFIDEATAVQRNGVLTAKKTDALVGRGDVPRGGLLAGALALGAPPAHVPPVQLVNAVPFAEPHGAPLEPAAPAAITAATAATPTAATTPASANTARRRGRPAKTDSAPPAAQGEPVAPFRAAEPVAAPNGAAPPGQFGMAAAPEPNPELAAALKSVFG